MGDAGSDRFIPTGTRCVGARVSAVCCGTVKPVTPAGHGCSARKMCNRSICRSADTTVYLSVAVRWLTIPQIANDFKSAFFSLTGCSGGSGPGVIHATPSSAASSPLETSSILRGRPLLSGNHFPRWPSFRLQSTCPFLLWIPLH